MTKIKQTEKKQNETERRTKKMNYVEDVIGDVMQCAR